jgi:Xaa-Pro dipeptidase
MENQFGCFHLGGKTHSVAMSMHKEIRDRLFKEIAALDLKNACAVFQGGKALTRNDTDHELLFRQESYFQYLFGVKEANWYVYFNSCSYFSCSYCLGMLC